MSRTAVVAVGGNALVPDGHHSSITAQFEQGRNLARSIVAIMREGWRVILTHGNGPQVGFILQRSDLVATIAPEIPRLGLDLCVAESQGSIGYILAHSLRAELREAGLEERVAAIVTQTVVAADDPAFVQPTKPIGAWYSREDINRFAAENGWEVAEDGERGWRRVVPSPMPLRILEMEAIAALMAAGFLVVAGGGGGIPLVEDASGELHGVAAVIDKDHLSALLASELGVDLFVMATAVAQVAINFGRADQRFLAHLTAAEAAGYLAEGQFPPGSMGPKISAALTFLARGTGDVLITSLDRLPEAMRGKSGTRISREAAVLEEVDEGA